MQCRHGAKRSRGFTLIEVLVVVALLVTILTLLAPSFNRLIVTSRLKSINAQLVADLQFARAEAAARNVPVWWTYRTSGSGPSLLTCYTIYTSKIDGVECNCALGPGAACGVDQTEIKVVQVPVNTSIRLGISSGEDSFAFDNVSGGIYNGTTDFTNATLGDFLIRAFVSGDSSRALNTLVSPAGRPSVCSAGSTRIQGFPACPS